MDKKYLSEELINKYNKGTCTEEERAIVESWHLFDLKKDTLLPSGKDILSASERMRGRVLSHARVSTKQINLWPRISAAIAIIVILFGAGLWYLGNSNKIENSAQYVNDIAPGKNGATLTLANGQKISIKDAVTGNIAKQPGVKISKTADGQIIYEITETNSDIFAYNTLSTTRGEQTKVRLPDGTLVFLNSESSLKYPTSFAKSKNRTVSLEGEGFFDVSKDKSHPFIVKVNNQEVEVLGTQFNINSYSDQPSTRTTLIEGSVKISSNNQTKILKPGQQATVSNKDILVQDIEAQFSTDWKEGFFMFDNETLESIMKRVARWYDIKVVYEDQSLKSKKISGTVSKFENISAVIQTMEQGKFADFRLDNGVLTISKRK